MFSLITIHLYQNAYLNSITNYFIKGNAGNYFETECWGKTCRKGALWLNENMEEDTGVCVSKSIAFIVNYYLKKKAPTNFSVDFL